MTIELGKTYLTGSGCKIRIICIDRISRLDTPIVGLMDDKNEESIYTYYSNGRYSDDIPHPLDLIKEYSFWNDVKIDTKILVRDDESHSWHKAYFAGYKNGFVKSFAYDATSWSSTNFKISWKYAKLAEKD